MKNLRTLLILLFLNLIFVSSSFAYYGQVLSSGKGVFVLQGVDMPGAAGFEAKVYYTGLRNPRVQKGGIGASMFVVNTNTTGEIKMVGIDQSNIFTGTNSIAVISFDTIPGTRGSVSLGTFSVATVSGNITPQQTNSNAVPDSDVDTGTGTGTTGGSENTGNPRIPTPYVPAGTGAPALTAGPSGTIGTSGTGTGTTTYLGGVTMPGDTSKTSVESPRNEPAAERPQNQQAEEPVRSAAREPETVEATAPEKTKPAGESKFVAHKSLLDQFKEYKDPQTPKTVLSLVGSFTVPSVTQDPPVALSDGKSTVKVRLSLPGGGKESPNFALKGAKLVSLNNDEKDTWVIEALPAKNANDVRVTVLQDDVMTEIPLVVAQPLSANAVARDGKWDQAAFAYFLKERGGEKDPKYDFNGDGVRNYIDDYIYALNYVSRNGMKTEKDAKPEPKKPEEAKGKEPVKPPKVK